MTIFLSAFVANCFGFCPISVKEPEEKTRSRTQEYEDMRSILGKLWLFPNSTDLQMVLTERMYIRDTENEWKMCHAFSFILKRMVTLVT